MGKTSIFLSTASRELSAIYSSYGAKLPFGWWRIKADMGNRWGILNGLRKEYLVIASQNIDAGAIADQNC